MYLWDILCYGILLSQQFWQAWAPPFVMKRESTQRLSIVWIRTKCFFFHWQMANLFAVQDKFTRKTQDLLLGVLLGLKKDGRQQQNLLYYTIQWWRLSAKGARKILLGMPAASHYTLMKLVQNRFFKTPLYAPRQLRDHVRHDR